MIRNGKIVDTKHYVDFVNKHPDLPGKYKTYYDYYLAETESETGRQITLEEVNL